MFLSDEKTWFMQLRLIVTRVVDGGMTRFRG